MTSIREIAALSRVIAGGGKVTASIGNHAAAYPVLLDDPMYPTCLREPTNDLLIELIPEAPTFYTVPAPMCLGSTLSYAYYYRSHSRSVQTSYKAFWKKAIQRCQPNEVQITITGVREQAHSEMTIPPRVALEAAADLTALANALAGASLQN